MTRSSYNIRHSKAMVFPGLRPGAAALFSGGEGIAEMTEASAWLGGGS